MISFSWRRPLSELDSHQQFFRRSREIARMVILDGMETVLETLEMLEHGRAGRFRILTADGVDNHLVKLCGVPRTGQAAHALAQPQHRLGEYLHEQFKHTVARGAGQDQVELLVVLEALL